MIMEMLMKKLTKLTTAAVVVALAIGGAVIGVGLNSAPSVAAPLPKAGSSTSDLAALLKTARPITPGLLEQDEVLADLKCTPEQRQAIAEVMKAARDELREAFQKMIAQRRPPGPAAGGVGGAVGGGFSFAGRLNIDSEKLLAPLKPEQVLRARQLDIQLKGPQAFTDRRVVRALALTAEQEQKIEEILVHYESESTSPAMAIGGGGADNKAFAERNGKVMADCLKLVSKEQKASWDRLIGPVLEPGPWLRTGIGQTGGFSVAPVVPVPPKKVEK